MAAKNEPEGGRVFFEIGTGAVRVEIVEDAYGFLECRPLRYRYSIIEGETGTSDRFDPSLIDELSCRLEQARTFFAQQAVSARSLPLIGKDDPIDDPEFWRKRTLELHRTAREYLGTNPPPKRLKKVRGALRQQSEGGSKSHVSSKKE